MSKWAKAWWVLAALWELVILAGVAGATIAGAWLLLMMVTWMLSLVHLVYVAGPKP